MVKRIFAVLLSCAVLGCLSGCSDGSISASLSVMCQGEEGTVSVTEGDVLIYNICGEDYGFTVTHVSDKEVGLKVDQYGLAKQKEDGGFSLLSKEDSFVVKRGEALGLHAQVTDTFGDTGRIVFERK